MTESSSLPVLGYWNIRCLAEPIRLMLRHVGVDFIDKQYLTGPAPAYERPEWNKDKISLGFDFPNVPYWIDGSLKLTESWAILKHIARMNKQFYPNHDDEELKCDMLQGVLEQFRYRFIDMCYSKNSEQFAILKQTFLDSLDNSLDKFEIFMKDNKWLVGNSLMYVDFVFAETLSQICLFKPDFLKNHPVLNTYFEKFENLGPIKNYRNSDLFHVLPINSKYAYWGGGLKL